MIDCLIASTAGRLGLPLFTRNLKHFGRFTLLCG
jgi:predicted nucleic acid-binding protein